MLSVLKTLGDFALVMTIGFVLMFALPLVLLYMLCKWIYPFKKKDELLEYLKKGGQIQEAEHDPDLPVQQIDLYGERAPDGSWLRINKIVYGPDGNEDKR